MAPALEERVEQRKQPVVPPPPTTGKPAPAVRLINETGYLHRPMGVEINSCPGWTRLLGISESELLSFLTSVSGTAAAKSILPDHAILVQWSGKQAKRPDGSITARSAIAAQRGRVVAVESAQPGSGKKCMLIVQPTGAQAAAAGSGDHAGVENKDDKTRAHVDSGHEMEAPELAGQNRLRMRAEHLLQRLRQLQFYQLHLAVHEELRAFLHEQKKLMPSRAVAGLLGKASAAATSAAAVAACAETQSLWMSQEVKAMSTAQLVKYIQRLQDQQKTGRGTSAGTASASGSEPSTPAEELLLQSRCNLDPVAVETVTGSLVETLRHVEQAVDSEATESSDSSDDEERVLHEKQKTIRGWEYHSVPLKNRVSYRYAAERATLASHFSWLQIKVSEVRNRLKAEKERYARLRQAKPPVLLQENAVSFLNALSSDSTVAPGQSGPCPGGVSRPATPAALVTAAPTCCPSVGPTRRSLNQVMTGAKLSQPATARPACGVGRARTPAEQQRARNLALLLNNDPTAGPELRSEERRNSDEMMAMASANEHQQSGEMADAEDEGGHAAAAGGAMLLGQSARCRALLSANRRPLVRLRRRRAPMNRGCGCQSLGANCCLQCAETVPSRFERWSHAYTDDQWYTQAPLKLDRFWYTRSQKAAMLDHSYHIPLSKSPDADVEIQLEKALRAKQVNQLMAEDEETKRALRLFSGGSEGKPVKLKGASKSNGAASANGLASSSGGASGTLRELKTKRLGKKLSHSFNGVIGAGGDGGSLPSTPERCSNSFHGGLHKKLSQSDVKKRRLSSQLDVVNRKRFRGASTLLTEANSPSPSSGAASHCPSPVPSEGKPQKCQGTGSGDEPAVRRRRIDSSAYSIDDIVIPSNMATASARVEKLNYKEIITPKWRDLSEWTGSDSPCPRRASVSSCELSPQTPCTSAAASPIPAALATPRSSRDEEEVEDLTDTTFEIRHLHCEQIERKRFLSFVTPGGPRRVRPSGESATDGDSSCVRSRSGSFSNDASHDSPTAEATVAGEGHLARSLRASSLSLLVDDGELQLVAVGEASWTKRTFPLLEAELDQMEVENNESSVAVGVDCCVASSATVGGALTVGVPAAPAVASERVAKQRPSKPSTA